MTGFTGALRAITLERKLALEEDSSGKTKLEKELVFYARIESSEVFKKANQALTEFQKQFELRIPKSEDNLSAGRIRVRATSLDNGIFEYVQTTKIKTEGGENETSVKVTEDVFEQFKLLANAGMVKTRYIYDIPDRQEKWEVDVFRLESGALANWVKIDFEFIDMENKAVPELPEGFLDIIPSTSKSKEDQDFIYDLYEKVFLASGKNDRNN